MAKTSGSLRVVLAALFGNLAIAVTKFVAFYFTRSTAMLTEGIHSVVDTGDQLLLLIGQKRAARPPDPSHPFGYGMETYFWSFIVALMIFLVGGAVSIWEGFEKLLHPEPVGQPWINFGVLGAAMIFEGFSFHTAYKEYRNVVQGRDVRLWRFLKLSKDPNLFATLLEDGAALVGLALAASGIAASTFLGQAWADGAASIAIGLVLVAVALFLANETRSLIAGEAAAPSIVERARDAATAGGEGERLENLVSLHLGPRSILIALTVKFSPDLCGDGLDAAMSALAGRVRDSDERIQHVVFRPSAT